VENEFINGGLLSSLELLPKQFFSFLDTECKELFAKDQPVFHALYALKARTWKNKISTTIPHTVAILNIESVEIEEGVIIDPFACIEGPCYIGKNCHIGHAAYIRPFSYLSHNCSIGHSAEIKASILFPFAKATHLCFVGDSILGAHVNLGAGTKCANLRFDDREVELTFREKKYATGLRKFGSILSDYAKTGCNVVLNPGTVIEKHEMVFNKNSILSKVAAK